MAKATVSYDLDSDSDSVEDQSPDRETRNEQKRRQPLLCLVVEVTRSHSFQMTQRKHTYHQMETKKGSC